MNTQEHDLFQLLIQHFWALMIVVITLNALIARRRAQSRIEADPALGPKLNRLYFGGAALLTFPCLMMGVVVLSGEAPDTIAALHSAPSSFVGWLPHICLLLLDILFLRWVFVGRGYEFVSLHSERKEDRPAYKHVLRGLALIAPIIHIWTLARAGAFSFAEARGLPSEDPDWIIVFDALATPWWWSGPVLVPPVVALFGTGFLFSRDSILPLIQAGLISGPRSRLGYYLFAVPFTAFAYVLAAIFVWNAYRTEKVFQAAYADDMVVNLEGQVTNFIPESDRNNVHESFTVNGKRFQYSAFRHTGGFNLSRETDGPIREGLEVRIWYIEGNGNRTILRLETRR